MNIGWHQSPLHPEMPVQVCPPSTSATHVSIVKDLGQLPVLVNIVKDLSNKDLGPIFIGWGLCQGSETGYIETTRFRGRNFRDILLQDIRDHKSLSKADIFHLMADKYVVPVLCRLYQLFHLTSLGHYRPQLDHIWFVDGKVYFVVNPEVRMSAGDSNTIRSAVATLNHLVTQIKHLVNTSVGSADPKFNLYVDTFTRQLMTNFSLKKC